MESVRTLRSVEQAITLLFSEFQSNQWLSITSVVDKRSVFAVVLSLGL